MEVINFPTYFLYLGSQGDDNWKKHRKYPGKLNASNVGKALKHSIFDSPEDVADDILEFERKPKAERKPGAMQRGNLREPLARDWYERQFGVTVQQICHVTPKWEPRLGGSPDGLVNDDGGVEFKCPDSLPVKIKLYLQRCKSGVVPEGHWHIYDEHYDQIQTYMAIMKRNWWDYVVYAEDDNTVFRQTIYFDEKYWNDCLYPGINEFLYQKLPNRLLEKINVNITPAEAYNYSHPDKLIEVFKLETPQAEKVRKYANVLFTKRPEITPIAV
jgi:hypothetical protein